MLEHTPPVTIKYTNSVRCIMTNDFQYEEANPAKSLLAIPGSFLLDFILFLNIQITNDKKKTCDLRGNPPSTS